MQKILGTRLITPHPCTQHSHLRTSRRQAMQKLQHRKMIFTNEIKFLNGNDTRRRVQDLDGNLCTNLDHTPGRYLEKVGGIARGPGQSDEQVVLPRWHSRFRRWLERSARQ